MSYSKVAKRQKRLLVSHMPPSCREPHFDERAFYQDSDYVMAYAVENNILRPAMLAN